MAEPASARPLEEDDRSIGDLVSVAIGDLTKLVSYEVSLAKSELRADLQRIGVSSALGATIVFTGFLVLVMLCFALAYGLQTVGVWDWASFLIVGFVLVVLAAVCAGIIWLKVRRMNKLSKTRESVQSSLALLRPEEEGAPSAPVPAAPAPIAPR